jgi:hypothetical protein
MDKNCRIDINTELAVWASAPTKQSTLPMRAVLHGETTPLTSAMFRF